MTRSRVLLGLLAICATTLAAACQPGGDAQAPSSAPAGSQASATDDATQIVATLDGAPITLAELEAWMREDILERELGSKSAQDLYEMQKAAVQGLVDERLIAAEATRRGVEPEAVVEARIAELGPVSEEEVAAFYEENKSRVGDRTLEELSSQIRSYLESQRPDEALASFREQAVVEVQLEQPRIEVGGSGPSKGPESAPITIVEFSDYQCPFCKRSESVIEEVLTRYPEQVRFVYRHLPLPMHPHARPAAEAAVCAEEQGKFWPFHALLFENNKALSEEDLTKYAEQAGLDTEAYQKCRESESASARVTADLAAGQEAGARGTPAFFINGIFLNGARPIESFIEVIDAELQRQGTAEAS